METLVELQPTFEALNEHVAPMGFSVPVTVEYYGHDERIDWNVYIVKDSSGGVVGFTDQMPGPDSFLDADSMSSALAIEAKNLVDGMDLRVKRHPDIADFKVVFMRLLKHWGFYVP